MTYYLPRGPLTFTRRRHIARTTPPRWRFGPHKPVVISELLERIEPGTFPFTAMLKALTEAPRPSRPVPVLPELRPRVYYAFATQHYYRRRRRLDPRLLDA